MITINWLFSFLQVPWLLVSPSHQQHSDIKSSDNTIGDISMSHFDYDYDKLVIFVARSSVTIQSDIRSSDNTIGDNINVTFW